MRSRKGLGGNSEALEASQRIHMLSRVIEHDVHSLLRTFSKTRVDIIQVKSENEGENNNAIDRLWCEQLMNDPTVSSTIALACTQFSDATRHITRVGLKGRRVPLDHCRWDTICTSISLSPLFDVHIQNAAYFSSLAEVKTPITRFIGKCIPMRCQNRVFNRILRRALVRVWFTGIKRMKKPMFDDSVFQALKQIVLCGILGNYPHCTPGTRPTVFVRHRLYEIFNDKRHERWVVKLFHQCVPIVVLSVRTMMIVSYDHTPSLHHVLHKGCQSSHGLFNIIKFKEIVESGMVSLRMKFEHDLCKPGTALYTSFSRLPDRPAHCSLYWVCDQKKCPGIPCPHVLLKTGKLKTREKNKQKEQRLAKRRRLNNDIKEKEEEETKESKEEEGEEDEEDEPLNDDQLNDQKAEWTWTPDPIHTEFNQLVKHIEPAISRDASYERSHANFDPLITPLQKRHPLVPLTPPPQHENHKAENGNTPPTEPLYHSDNQKYNNIRHIHIPQYGGDDEPEVLLCGTSLTAPPSEAINNHEHAKQKTQPQGTTRNQKSHNSQHSSENDQIDDESEELENHRPHGAFLIHHVTHQHNERTNGKDDKRTRDKDDEGNEALVNNHKKYGCDTDEKESHDSDNNPFGTFLTPLQWRALIRIIECCGPVGYTGNALPRIVKFFPCFQIPEDVVERILQWFTRYRHDSERVEQLKTRMMALRIEQPHAYNLLHISVQLLKQCEKRLRIWELPHHIATAQLDVIQDEQGRVLGNDVSFVFCHVCMHIYSNLRDPNSNYKNSYRYGLREAPMDFLTGKVFCTRGKQNHRGRCGEKELARIPMIGKVLYYQLKAIMKCPQVGCGALMVIDAKQKTYMVVNERGPACISCSAKLDRRVQAIEQLKEKYTSDAHEIECILCVGMFPRQRRINRPHINAHIYPYSIHICNKHHTPQIQIKVQQYIETHRAVTLEEQFHNELAIRAIIEQYRDKELEERERKKHEHQALQTGIEFNLEDL
jgi:hypothetical protein